MNKLEVGRVIEVEDIRIWEDVSGLAGKYTLEVRMIDREQGTSVGESGLTLWNWDKCFSYNDDDLERITNLAGERLTELLNE